MISLKKREIGEQDFTFAAEMLANYALRPLSLFVFVFKTKTGAPPGYIDYYDYDFILIFWLKKKIYFF